MGKKRLKVLVGCYACDPNFGSEPGAGWHFVRILARLFDLHVIVEKDEFEANLSRYSVEHPDEVKNITFHYIRRKHYPLLRKIWPPSYYWSYDAWQRAAYRYAVELHKKEHFDLVHQITLAGYRSPGELWKLDIPFIWGPIGGLNQTAWTLLPSMGLYGMVFYTMRNIINAFQKRWSTAARVVAPKAHTIFISDSAECELLQRLWKRDFVVLSEVGSTRSLQLEHSCEHVDGAPLEVCWAGVHEPRKGLNLLLQAVSLCKRPVHVHVLGHGPCTQKWKKQAERLNIDSYVTFYGRIPHDQVLELMQSCHVFCLTSLSEGGTTNVVVEAMQQGLPIIALNHCAFASVVDASCGIKIDIHPGRCIPQRIADALDELASTEQIRQNLVKGALARSAELSWDAKLEVINEVYTRAAATTEE